MLHRRNGLFFHMLTALVLVSYVGKGIYFIASEDPVFSPRRNVLLSDVPLYTVAGVLIALFFWIVVVTSSRRQGGGGLEKLVERLHEIGSDVGSGNLLAAVGFLIVASFVYEHGSSAIEGLTAGTILRRTGTPDLVDFESGSLGVRQFFAQLRIGTMYFVTAHAVMRRRPVLLCSCALFFGILAGISNGSRFMLLGGISTIPLIYYMVRRRDAGRALVVPMYLAAVLLPVLAASLLEIRRGSDVDPTAHGAWDTMVVNMAATFDSLDHLVNYLDRLPIDWTGTRMIEEFWQVLPRAVFPDKPFSYGSIALQDLIYPRGLGAHYLYGHYPMSIVVTALDQAGPIGLVLCGILAGRFVALIDEMAKRTSLICLGIFAYCIANGYHLIRAGIVSFLIGSIAPIIIPTLITVVLLKIPKHIAELIGQRLQEGAPGQSR